MTISREDPRFWDVRTLDRHVRKNHITRKDVDKYLKALPDSGDKAATVALDAPDDDDE
ncbi:MAG: hypothetical protein ACHQ17_12345 [Polyangia bacterium]|jgi:hypothetical protein